MNEGSTMVAAAGRRDPFGLARRAEALVGLVLFAADSPDAKERRQARTLALRAVRFIQQKGLRFSQPDRCSNGAGRCNAPMAEGRV